MLNVYNGCCWEKKAKIGKFFKQKKPLNYIDFCQDPTIWNF